MLAVPILAGVVRSRGGPAQVPLVGFWIAAYFAFNAFGVWVAARRRRRDLPPLLVYGAVATTLGVVTVVLRPDLLRMLPWFVPLIAVSLWCTWTRRERSMPAGVATIAAASLFGYVVYLAGYSPDGTIEAGRTRMLAVVVACAAYFVGTALYVKTIIRERNSVRYRRLSIGYHLIWTLIWAVAALGVILPGDPLRIPGTGGYASVAMTVFFAVLTVRACLLAGRRLRPRDVGIGEIAASTVLLVIVTLIWP